MFDFYEEIYKWKKCGNSIVNTSGCELICYVHPTIKNDYLHILFYPLGKSNKKDFEEYINLKRNDKLKQYFDFICRHNGCILYSGAIVIFGYTDDISINTFKEPPSLKRMNDMNRFCMDNKDYLYIGNLMSKEKDNINIYINRRTGYILWHHKGEIFKEFTNLTDMLEHIIEFYNRYYNSNGENINYKNKSKNVYENIQLY